MVATGGFEPPTNAYVKHCSIDLCSVLTNKNKHINKQVLKLVVKSNFSIRTME